MVVSHKLQTTAAGAGLVAPSLALGKPFAGVSLSGRQGLEWC